MNGEHRYNIPMFGVKHWYQHEMEAVGHLASMEDAYLRRMYASKVVSGMNHLSRAIAEKINDPGYEHKKRDLELMKDGVKRTMEHLKKDYDVTEDNISYKWNTGANKNMTMPSTVAPMSMPSSFEPNMNMPSFNENTLSLNSEDEPSFNENMPILTLNNMKNFATAKTGNSNMNKNVLNLNNTKNMLNLNNKNTLNFNNTKNMLNLNKNTLNLNNNNKNVLNLNNKNTLNLNKKNTLNLNKNKNKNTLIGGRRRRNRRYTRRA